MGAAARLMSSQLASSKGVLPIMSGLTVFLDATDATTLTKVGTRVDLWKDKSGNGNDFGTGHGGTGFNPNFVSTLFGNKGGIRFIGGSLQFLDSVAAVPALKQNSYTVIFVGRRKSQASFYGLTDYQTPQSLAGWSLDDRIGSETLCKCSAGGSYSNDYVYGMSWNGTAGTGYLDGKPYPLIMTGGMKATATSCQKLEIAAYHPQSNTGSDLDLAAVVVYNRVLSDGEMLTLCSYLHTLYGLTSPAAPTRNILFDGNSIVEGFAVGSVPFPGKTISLLGLTFADFKNFGISGQNTGQMVTAFSSRIAPLFNAGLLAKYNVYCMFEITNDLVATQSQATAQAHIQSVCAAAQAAGFKVVVGTCLPRNGQYAAFETDRLAVNVWLRANYLTFADYLADCGGDATIGATGAASNTTYYADGVHPTTAGAAIIAGYFHDGVVAVTA